MPVVAWLTRSDIGPPWGSRIFFATLIVATISVAIRLNLYFIARVQPASLAEHRAAVFPWLFGAEVALDAILLAAAAFPTREAFAAPIVIVAIASLASLLLIEPATTRAAGLSGPPPSGGT